ncbi:MAG: amino acid ABC transporter substrate-binding protein [Chloroflexota bacterium]|nr:amino acid ABC transporter substrate-binding protein [Chloroflexota bacterium]MDE2900512.1 amino acid ABC transporter substrate-binding protein [Chloroflexota bacterium]MDE2968715.1 amino acid ABC transporter substrate-binding protein [Chloroflexota bacterium]
MNRHGRLVSLFAVMAALLVVFVVAACESDDGEDARENTLDVIIERGNLICGVKADTPGFGVLNPDGSAEGNDVDYCRALAAAVFGDASKVEFKEATSANRFELLAAKEIDVLIRTTTWTASRDADLEVAYAPTTFYDGAGIMVHAGSGVGSVNELGGSTICILDGTSTQGAVSDYFAENGLTYSELTLQDNAAIRGAFIGGQCDAWSSDKSQLGGHQFTLKSDDGIDAVVLPETLSKEPLGPSVRDYDSEWEDVVRWVVNGMIIAEEQGVTSANVSAMAANPPNNTVARLLGVGFDGGAPSNLGIGHGKIPGTFMQSVISQVGNYGEAYDATLEAVGLTRAGSLNDSYVNGGLIYSPPMR